MKKLAILGSTGSIGTQALCVAENLGLEVTALTAHKNLKLLEQQVRKFSPATVVVTDEETYKEALVKLSDNPVKLLFGMDSVCEIASDSKNDVVLNSLVGMRGLKPTMCAIEAGVDVALANKETLVTGVGVERAVGGMIFIFDTFSILFSDKFHCIFTFRICAH